MMQAKAWLDSGLINETFMVAINTSAMQMQSGDLVDIMRQLFAETGLPTQCIDLELTESVLMANVSENRLLLKQLKAIGQPFQSARPLFLSN